MRRLGLLALGGVPFATLTVAGCGSSTGQTAVPSRAAVATPAAVSNQPIIRDVAALGRAAAAGATDHSIRDVYDLLATAQSLPNDREGWKGLALIRTRLPLIVDRLTAAYPKTKRRLDRVRIETAGGNALRAWLLDAYRLQLRDLVQLRREVTTGGYAWAAVLRWSEVNHQETAGFSTRLSSILRALPATQQLGIERAITTYLG